MKNKRDCQDRKIKHCNLPDSSHPYPLAQQTVNMRRGIIFLSATQESSVGFIICGLQLESSYACYK